MIRYLTYVYHGKRFYTSSSSLCINLVTASQYTLTVKTYNALQYSTVGGANFIGVIACLCLFMGLSQRKNQTGLNHYRDIILLLSATYLVYCIAYLILLPVFSLPSGVIYPFGKYYPSWLTYSLIIIGELAQKYGNELLAGSIIYKVISFVR